jgi:hypothetical protein
VFIHPASPPADALGRAAKGAKRGDELMSSENKVVLSALVALSVVGPAVLGAGLGWPFWTWLLLTALCLVGTAFAHRALVQRKRQDDLQVLFDRQQADSAAPEAPFEAHPVPATPLPSSRDGYHFVFSATVHWRRRPDAPGIPHSAPAQLAVDAVLRRARDIAEREEPEHHALVQQRLNSALGWAVAEERGHVDAYATEVTTRLSNVDSERVRRLADVRKDEEVWEHERNHERRKRAYLAEEVLKDPGSAVVWWLANHEDQVRDTVALIGELAKLSAAANNLEQWNGSPGSDDVARADQPTLAPPPWASGGDGAFQEAIFTHDPFPASQSPSDHVRGLLDSIGVDSGSPHRQQLADRVAGLVDVTGQHEAAEDIRRAFIPAGPSADDEAGSGDDHEPAQRTTAAESAAAEHTAEPTSNSDPRSEGPTP